MHSRFPFHGYSSVFYLVYFYLPMLVSMLHISFLLIFWSSCQTWRSAELLHSRLQFLWALWRPNPSYSFIYLELRCLGPCLLALYDCRYPPFTSLDRLDPLFVGRRPHYSVPSSIGKGTGGVCPPRVPRHTPSLKTENLMTRC